MVSAFFLITLVSFLWPLVSSNGQNCETTSPDLSGYRCDSDAANQKCQAFAVLRPNSSYYPTLSNLSYYLGLDRVVIAEANGISSDAELFLEGQLLLIPIGCKCNGNIYEANLIKTAIKGETFDSVAESFQGLTTCRALKEKNPRFSSLNLAEEVKLLVPLRCSCPDEFIPKARFLVSYPVSEHESVSDLALQFNVTEEAILSANNQSLLVPFTTLLVPVNNNPTLNSSANPKEPNPNPHPNPSFPARTVPVGKTHKRKGKKMSKIKLYIGLGCVIAGLSIAGVVVFVLLWLKKENRARDSSIKRKDPELQQLSLSIRTTSEKKVSFDGSHDTSQDCQILETTTPRKALIETYSLEDLKVATDEFSSSNHIEGSVYHGILKGKDLAVKKIKAETAGKIDFGLMSNPTYFHPNIIRFLGSCLIEEERENGEGYLVLEYARNGSLRDWIHNKLAIKNQFIASCYCFLAWNQRVRICYDVAVALQFMHQIGYVHCNIKSRNIFLDEDFKAKVGNFGMPECFQEKTDDLKADPGYLAPEFLQEGSVSSAIDIFAYGMVVLEVLSGETPTRILESQVTSQIWISGRLKSFLEPLNTEEFREMMDHALGDNYSLDAAIELVKLARLCVEQEPGVRPTASEIVERVSKLVEREQQEEEEMLEKGNSLISESSCKPLVKAVCD